MKTNTFEHQAGNILSVLGNPFRIQLVFALGAQEACVCHLEALLKKRQAYISQHLMALREAGMLETRRDGKFVYYRLSNPEILELVRYAAEIAGVDQSQFPRQHEVEVLDKCICPHCDGGSSVPYVKKNRKYKCCK
jgi:DNA-binding transcriptional ArsR family regulator